MNDDDIDEGILSLFGVFSLVACSSPNMFSQKYEWRNNNFDSYLFPVSRL